MVADQSAVETAQAKVATARQTDSQKQAEVAKAQTNQTQAKTARDASQKNLQEKTAAAEKTQSDLNQAQQALQKAQAGKITTEASSNKKPCVNDSGIHCSLERANRTEFIRAKN